MHKNAVLKHSASTLHSFQTGSNITTLLLFSFPFLFAVLFGHVWADVGTYNTLQYALDIYHSLQWFCLSCILFLGQLLDCPRDQDYLLLRVSIVLKTSLWSQLGARYITWMQIIGSNNLPEALRTGVDPAGVKWCGFTPPSLSDQVTGLTAGDFFQSQRR